MATIDLFPLGAPDAAFERLSALLTTLRDALATLRTCDDAAASNSGSGSGSDSNSNPRKPQISLADLTKKAAESDAKAHKWEVDELRATIAGLRDELSVFSFLFFFCLRKFVFCFADLTIEGKVKTERKSVPASRLQDVPEAQDKLASHHLPTDGLVASPTLELDTEMADSETDVRRLPYHV